MRGLRRLSPRQLVLGLGILAVSLAIVGFCGLAYGERQRALRDAATEAKNTGALLSEQIGRLFDATVLTLEVVIERTKARPWDDIATSIEDYRFLQQFLQFEFITALWLTDEYGRPRLTSRSFPAPAIDTSDREYFRDAKAGVHGPLISDLLRSRYENKVNMVLARRLEYPNGAFKGIVQAVIEPQYFLDFVSSLHLKPQSEVMLVREDGAVLFRYPSLPEGPAIRLRAGALQGSATFDPRVFEAMRVSEFDGIARISEVELIDRFPVYVLVGMSREAALSQWWAGMLPHAVLASFAILALGLFALAAAGAVQREGLLTQDLERRVDLQTAELRAAVAEKELLLAEVNHRVKNNLQILSSLLGFQGARVEDPTMRHQFEDAQARITSVANIHRNLYTTGTYDRLDLASYLRALCEDLARSLLPNDPRERLRVEAQPIELPTKMVVPLALIINELIINAIKHGVEQPAAGVIVVRVRVRGDEVAVEIDDPAGPGELASAPADGKGIGMKLVMAWIQQLQGRLDVQPLATGRRLIVSVPIREAFASVS